MAGISDSNTFCVWKEYLGKSLRDSAGLAKGDPGENGHDEGKKQVAFKPKVSQKADRAV